MRFHIITVLPEVFDSYLSASILGRAIKTKKIEVKVYQLRDFAEDKHKRIDDRPYGGGPGMVLKALPILKAVKKIKTGLKKRRFKTIVFSAGGKKLSNSYLQKNLKRNYTDIILICGRYEGVDQRVVKALKAEELSIGDYVLTGGELPAMILIDTWARKIPGVLGKIESLEEKRVAGRQTYTRPEEVVFDGRKYKVPKVLVSGDHKKINDHRRDK